MQFALTRCVAVLCTIVVVIALEAIPNAQGARQVRARAIIAGPGGIEGVATFSQGACPGCLPPPGLLFADPSDLRFEDFPEPTVDIDVRVFAPAGVLMPGAHGIQIHEFARCDPPAYFSAGGHFDPGPNRNSNPDVNHPFHMGDLPNLIVDKHGNGRLRHTTSRITLSPGPLTVFDGDDPRTPEDDTGSSILIKLNPDRGRVVEHFDPANPPGTSGGPRIACGVIEMVSEDAGN